MTVADDGWEGGPCIKARLNFSLIESNVRNCMNSGEYLDRLHHYKQSASHQLLQKVIYIPTQISDC